MRHGTSHGEKKMAVRNHYKELTMHLQRRGGLRIKLDVVFRVFDNGFGFRYVIPKQDCLRSNNKDNNACHF